MKIRVTGGEYDAKRVIYTHSQKCVGCKRETENCVKLYVSARSMNTICVEMNYPPAYQEGEQPDY